MKKLTLCFSIFASISILQAQFVSTFFSDPAKKVDDALVLDDLGNIYGSHYMGSNVYKITPAGVCTIFATGFNTPNGLAFDSQHNLFVCDMQGGRIYKLSYSGLFLDTIFVPNPSGIIKSPASDTMMFTQYQSNIVNKLAPDGTVIPIMSGAPLNGPVGLSYDSAGVLYVANFTDRKIFSFSTSTLNYVATVPGPSSGWLGFITYAKGSLWGTGYNDHKIYKINPYYTDSVIVYAGTTLGNSDGGIGTAQFNRPNGIKPSISGDSLFVSDFGSGRIRVISPHNLTTTIIEHKSTVTDINIYPSPFSDHFTIECKDKILDIKIYDTQGKLHLSTCAKEIDVKNLPAGVYFVSIYTDTGRSLKKVIKN